MVSAQPVYFNFFPLLRNEVGHEIIGHLINHSVQKLLETSSLDSLITGQAR